MLIRDAEVWGVGPADLRIAKGHIAAIGQLAALPGEPVIEARGGTLLPGLHDHHIHLAASAARAASIFCGPPEVADAAALAVRLAAASGTGWLRGVGYHESVMGLPDAAMLDGLVADRPLRIQHRGGRMWLLNSRALAELLELEAPPSGLERDNGRFTGRLFDADDWLRKALGSAPPPLDDLSRNLARLGVTGITEMSPRNARAEAGWLADEVERGALVQRVLLAGSLDLAGAPPSLHWQLGPAKLHLHDAALPDFDETVTFVGKAHAQGRALASHCTTETELVFTLAAVAEAGSLAGDRIEHAGIASDEHIAQIASMGLAIVSQPHFIFERGDQYRGAVDPRDQPLLYRLASFRRAGVSLAAGSDAPFGSLDPWAALAAAISRRTREREIMGADEALTAEQALALYLADPSDLTRQRSLDVGVAADLCLLDRPWSAAREALSSSLVRATIIDGRIVHDRIDQPPIERNAR